MKAFLGHSFDDKDKILIDSIQKFLESTGIECHTGEKAQNSSIAQKVKERIKYCEIFVGIFTRDKLICPHTPSKWFCNPKKRTDQYTTSNWVLQESGFAIGIDREIILLVENGIDKFPELQGDMEVIFFDRNSISEKYLQLNQMIEGIKIRISGGTATRPSEEDKQLDTPPKPEEKEEKPEEEPKGKKDEILNRVYESLLKDKDYTKAQKIFGDEAKPLLDKVEEARLGAYILRVSHSLGDESAFKKLQKMVQENPDNTGVIKHLARRYKEIEEYKKAKEYFLLTVDKYDINDAEQRDSFIDSHIQAAWCLVLDGNLNESINELNGLLLNPNLQESRAEIFEAMARISKEKGPVEDFLIFAEASLDIDPVNTQLRFELAYAYSNNNNEKLALLHYKKLTDTTKHISGLNNIGVSYSRLELKGKSIKNYFKAAEGKETLAMSNLANRYIDAGFIDKAQELINKAYDLHKDGFEVNSNIGSAQKRIKTMAEEENKKEEEILLEAKKESQYRVKCSNALCSDKKLSKTQVEDTWQTSWGSMQLKYNEENNLFEVEHKRKVEIGSYYLQGEKVYKDEVIKIKGTIRNLSGRYTIEVSDEKTATSLLTSGNIYKANGYMIINEKCDFIEIMENTIDGKTKYDQWKKHPNSTVEAVT